MSEQELPHERRPATQQFTVAWVAALVAVALLALFRSVLIQAAIDEQQNASSVLQLADEQRLIGVQIDEYAQQLLLRTDSESRRAALAGITEGRDSLIQVRDELRALGPDDADSPSTRLLGRTAGATSDLLDTTSAVIRELAPGGRGLEDDALADDVRTAEHRHRAALGQTVAAIERDVQDELQRAEDVDRAVLLGTLALLTILGLLLFVPITRGIRRRLESSQQEAAAERARARRQLEELARRDHLTGVANRTVFHERLAHAIETAARSEDRVGLMFLDLDNFKDVNDVLGHDVGDALLVEIAHRLTGVARRTDTVARLGGDEFVVVLEGIESADNAATAAQKVLDELARPIDVDARVLEVTTSIGIALYPDDATDASSLLRAADSAMYEAKKAGRATFAFSTPELREENVRRLQRLSELREAIAAGDLGLVYQPQVDLETGEIIGVEALVRWVSEDGRLVPASEFIAEAEETDLMHPLADWVLRAATKQAAVWRREHGLELVVGVNVSARQLRDDGFLIQVTRALDEADLDAQFLELEIAESTLSGASDELWERLQALHAIGVRIAVDNFGTGQSSLPHLRQLGVHSLKIHGSLSRHLATDNDESVLTAAATSLARHLGARSVAEGIESPQQLAELRRIGVDAIQGYLVCRPVTPEDLPAIVREHERGGRRAYDPVLREGSLRAGASGVQKS